MQYENGDDVDNEWALDTMEPDTYVLLLPVFWEATAEFETDGSFQGCLILLTHMSQNYG